MSKKKKKKDDILFTVNEDGTIIDKNSSSNILFSVGFDGKITNHKNNVVPKENNTLSKVNMTRSMAGLRQTDLNIRNLTKFNSNKNIKSNLNRGNNVNINKSNVLLPSKNTIIRKTITDTFSPDKIANVLSGQQSKYGKTPVLDLIGTGIRGAGRGISNIGTAIEENLPYALSYKKQAEAKMLEYEKNNNITVEGKKNLYNNYIKKYGNATDAYVEVEKQHRSKKQQLENIGGLGKFQDPEKYSNIEKEVKDLEYAKYLLEQDADILFKGSTPVELLQEASDAIGISQFAEDFGGDFAVPMKQIDEATQVFDKAEERAYQETPRLASLASNIGNLVPTIAATAITKSNVAGSTAFGLSAKGGYYNEYIDKGYSKAEAEEASNIMAGMELASEAIGGAVGGYNPFKKGALKELSEKNIYKTISSLLIEGGEETLSEVTSLAIDSEKEDISLKDATKRLTEAFLGGVALSAFMSGVGRVGSYAAKIANNEVFSSEDIQNLVEDEAKKRGITAEDYVKSKTNLLYDVIDNGTTATNENSIRNMQNTNVSIQNKSESLENITSLKESAETLKQKGYKFNETALNNLDSFISQRGLTAILDDSIDADGIYVNENGKRKIIINPNSKRAMEFVTVHEMAHDMEGTAEYKELQSFLQEYAQNKDGYETVLKEVKEAYEKYYSSKNLNISELNIQNETTNDMLAKALGNQEFIQELVVKKPNIAQRIYNWVTQVLMDSQATGKSFNQRRAEYKYLQQLKKKFEAAYTANNINKKDVTKYSVNKLENNIDNSDTIKTKGDEYGKEAATRHRDRTESRNKSVLLQGNENNMVSSGNAGGNTRENKIFSMEKQENEGIKKTYLQNVSKEKIQEYNQKVKSEIKEILSILKEQGGPYKNSYLVPINKEMGVLYEYKKRLKDLYDITLIGYYAGKNSNSAFIYSGNPKYVFIKVNAVELNRLRAVLAHEVGHVFEIKYPEMAKQVKNIIEKEFYNNDGTLNSKGLKEISIYKDIAYKFKYNKELNLKERLADQFSFVDDILDRNVLEIIKQKNKPAYVKLAEIIKKVFNDVKSLFANLGITKPSELILSKRDSLYNTYMSKKAQDEVNKIIRPYIQKTKAKGSFEKTANNNENNKLNYFTRNEINADNNKIKAGEKKEHEIKKQYEKRSYTYISNRGRALDSSRGMGRTIYRKFKKDFQTRGYIDVNGIEVSNSMELADVAQVFRDPRYETFRMVYVKDNKIVGTEAVSTKIPNRSLVFKTDSKGRFSQVQSFYKAKNRMERLNADGYYMVHNHPSGKAKASKDDIRITEVFMKKLPGFKGHVIINSGTYASIYRNTNGILVYENEVPIDNYNADEVDKLMNLNSKYNKTIKSVEELVSLADSIKNNPNHMSVIYADANNNIRLLEDIPNSFFNMSEEQILGYLKNKSRKNGVSHIFVATNNEDVYSKAAKLVEELKIEDAILIDSTNKEPLKKSARRELQDVMEGNERISVFDRKDIKSYRVGDNIKKYNYSKNESEKWNEFLDKNLDLMPNATKTKAEKVIQGRNSSKDEKYISRSSNKFINKLVENLQISKYSNKSVLKEVVQNIREEVINNGKLTEQRKNELFDEMYSNLVVEDKQYYEDYKGLLQDLKDTKFIVPDSVKSDIPDYSNWSKKNLNNLVLKKGTKAINIDTKYKELSSEYPDLFKDNIINPSDQLKKIVEIKNDISKSRTNLEAYNDKNLGSEYKKWARNDFNTLIETLENDISIAKRYRDEKNKKRAEKELINKEIKTIENIKELFALKKSYQKEYTKVLDKEVLTDSDRKTIDRLLENEITINDIANLSNKPGIIKVYNAQKPLYETNKAIKNYQKKVKESRYNEADELIQNIDNWKDKKFVGGFRYSRETAQRNIRDVVGDNAIAENINKSLFDRYSKNETNAVAEKNELIKRIKDLNLNTAKKYSYGNYKIDEATLAQLYIEKKLTDVEIREYGADVEKIKIAAGEFENILNGLINRMSDELVKNGYAPVEYRKNYFPHFSENKPDTFISKIANLVGIDMSNQDLPTDIAGITDTFKPGKTWMGNLLQRTGDKTDYDAYKALDRYISGAMDIIHHTSDIQRLRAFENSVRNNYASDSLKEAVERVKENEVLTEQEKDEQIEILYNREKTQLSNFVSWLRDYTNIIANKKSSSDRSWEKSVGRNVYNTMTNIESKIASNTIGGNLSVSLTNIAPLFQATAETNYGNMVIGMLETMKSTIKKDNFTSDFLIRRRGAERLSKTFTESISDIAGKPMQFIDNFVSESVVRAMYRQNIRKGMNEIDAIENADKYAASLMADRSKGALPTIFNNKNPISKLINMFQVEVNNTVSNYSKDMTRNSAGAFQLIKAYTKLAVGSHIFNEFIKAIRGGSNVLPDPIDWVKDIIMCIIGDDDEKEKAQKELLEGLVGSVPFVQSTAGLMGMSDVGRIPISSAMPDLTSIFGIAGTDKKYKKQVLVKELTKPLLYLGLPTGGAQVKKTAEGIITMIEGGSYKYDKEGNKILQYAVEDKSAKKIAQSAIFGKWSVSEAKEYINDGMKALNAKETRVYDNSTIPFKEFKKYTNSTLPKKSEKMDFIDNMDINESQKWDMYTGFIFSDKIREKDGSSQLNDAIYAANNGISKKDYINAYNNASLNDVTMPVLEDLIEIIENNVDLNNYISYKVTTKGIEKNKYKIEELKSAPYSEEDKKFMYQKINPNDDSYQLLIDIGIKIDDYLDYKMQEFESDKSDDGTLGGKTIKNSRKNKILNYINNSNLSYEQRLLLYGMNLTLSGVEKTKVFEYVNNSSLNTEDKLELLNKINGFKVYKSGKVTW